MEWKAAKLQAVQFIHFSGNINAINSWQTEGIHGGHIRYIMLLFLSLATRDHIECLYWCDDRVQFRGHWDVDNHGCTYYLSFLMTSVTNVSFWMCEVKNEWIYTYNFSFSSSVWYVIKHGNYFNFLFKVKVYLWILVRLLTLHFAAGHGVSRTVFNTLKFPVNSSQS